MRYRRRLRSEMLALAEGRKPLQPGALSAAPIPTYGSDTVIQFPPASDAHEEEEAVGELLEAVGSIYRSADDLKGNQRYDDLEAKLSTLNR